MATIYKGAEVTAVLNQKTLERANALKERGITPTMAILRVGDNAADSAYEKGASKRCDSVGIEVKHVSLDADIDQKSFMKALNELNDDENVHGILILRPLPAQLDEEEARMALKPEKDVDGITDGSYATVFTGKGHGFSPCTAQAVIEILDFYNIELTGVDVTVVGMSLVVGKPLASLLMNRNATVEVCHILSHGVKEKCRKADIVVSCAGCRGLITAENCREGQTVIDVGINFDDNGKMCGDVKFDEVEPIVKAITPVPGGVGSVTSSVLVSHVVDAAERLNEN